MDISFFIFCANQLAGIVRLTGLVKAMPELTADGSGESLLLKDFFVLIIKDIGIDFCADLCQPLPLADVLTVIGRKVLR